VCHHLAAMPHTPALPVQVLVDRYDHFSLFIRSMARHQ